ncbi:MAG: hypothetical protein ACQKBU_08920, partial [Verrucomicrobiales bacterium]
GLIHLSLVSMITEDWSNRRHPVSPRVLEKMELTKNSTPTEIRAAYARHGIELKDWMNIDLVDNQLLLMAYDGHHAYVRALHHFIDSGFTLTKDPANESSNSSAEN